jgi:hypothetical protein
MPRLLLSLLPVAAVAIAVALSCGKSRSEEPATRVIPPATAYAEPAPTAVAPPAPTAVAPPAPALPATAAEEPPSPEEVKAFERPVAK